MMLLVYILSLVTASKILELSFKNNFGQTFHDFSGNARTAVNGQSSLTTTDDTIGTDRGAYFSGGTTRIGLPPNDKVLSAFTLPSIFSITLWVMVQDIEFTIFTRYKDANNFIYIQRHVINKYIMVQIMTDTLNTGTITSNSNSLQTNIWTMVTLTISGTTLKINSNSSVVCTYTLSGNYVENGIYSGFIGTPNSGLPSLTGFVWLLLVADETTTYNLYGLSLFTPNCLSGSGSCTTLCPYVIYDIFSNTYGCISVRIDPSKDAFGISCVNPSLSCHNGVALDCTSSRCTHLSCKLNVNLVECWCPTNSIYVAQSCVCTSGYFNEDSCVNCESSCATCSSSLLCDTCIATNSYPDPVQGCTCNNGYYGTKPLTTANACSACYIDCATCIDELICLTCIDIDKIPDDVIGCKCNEGYCFINGYCFEIPTGYSIVGINCVLNTDLAFHIIFQETTGVVIDLAYNVSGVTGNSETFYPIYDTEDPYYTENRGYYFNGVSSIVTFETSLVISSEFTIEVWFMPTDVNGVLFTKQNPETLGTYFAVHLENSLRVLISNSTAEHHTVDLEVAPVLNEWNYFKFSSRFTGQYFEFLICLNHFAETVTSSALISIKDTSLASQLVIGGQMQKDLYYKGFIYELKLFNIFSLSSNTQTCMEPCTSCISTGTCLPNCDIAEYWAGYSYNNCSNCSFNCEIGCKDKRENCALCDDILCETCEGISNCNQCIDGAIFIENHCECTENFTTSEFSCNICQNGYVYNNICYKCKEKCLECDSKACTKCVNNADLIDKNCVCRLGYSGTDTCEYKLLYVNASVSNDNIVYLDFSMSLSNDLEINDLNLSISNISVLFSLEKYSATRFVLKPELILTKSEILVIQFIKEIVSSENGVLNVTEVEVPVNYIPSEIENPIIVAFKNTGELVSNVVSSTLVGISMMNPSPASLWSFLNNIQMIVYVYLIHINFTRRFTGFLLGLKKAKVFPNIFDYFDIDEGIPHRFTHAADLGFSKNAIMINIGTWVSCFIFFIIIYFVLRGISAILSLTRFKESKVNVFLIGKCEGYKYGFFLRLWIQCYIDILVSAIITFYDSNLKDLNQAYNLYLGTILFFAATCTPVVAFVVIYKKNQEKKEGVTNSQLGLWKSLFSEFKEDSNLSQSYFYTVFFIRRYFYVIILFVLNDYPIIQCCLCEILMLLMFFFISYSKPFGETVLNISNSISEFGMSCIFPIIAIFLFEISQDFQDFLDFVLIVLINVVVVPQIIASLYIFIRTIRQKVVSRRLAKVNVEQDPEVKFEGKIFIIPEIIEGNKIDPVSINSPVASSDFFSEKLFVSPTQSFSHETYSISSLRAMEESKVERKTWKKNLDST